MFTEPRLERQLRTGHGLGFVGVRVGWDLCFAAIRIQKVWRRKTFGFFLLLSIMLVLKKTNFFHLSKEKKNLIFNSTQCLLSQENELLHSNRKIKQLNCLNISWKISFSILFLQRDKHLQFLFNSHNLSEIYHNYNYFK